MPHDPYKALYLHIPFCVRRCGYCDFATSAVERDSPAIDEYVESLALQLRRASKEGELGQIETAYIGGGTPSHIGMGRLSMLLYALSTAMHLTPEVECTMEANPESLTEAMVRDIWALGVNRLSIGVQSFDDDLLRQMDRYDKYGCAAEILERIQEASPYFTSMNADMIFNFPAQTEDTLIRDIEMVVASGASQTTFYPLMASPSVERSLAATVGPVDYAREQRFYEIICDLLLGDLPNGQPGLFELGSAWTFNRRGTGAAGEDAMIDEYVVDYEEYPAIGSGGITYLGKNLYVNTFSVREYNEAIESGRMSMMGKTTFSLRDRMRYRFMMQLFGLRLDKRQFERDFGMSIERGLPAEMAFMRTCGAFAIDNDDELTLTPKGRYLVVVMMRQFFIGVNNLRDQARAALTGEERELIFGDGTGKACGTAGADSAGAVAAETSEATASEVADVAEAVAAGAVLDATEAVAAEE